MEVVQNSSNPFLVPWGGFKPCRSRVDCQVDVPNWHLFKALCEPLMGHASLPDYLGYCRCSTWLFRHGALCETNVDVYLVYYLLEMFVVLVAISVNTVLLKKVWSQHRLKYASLFETIWNRSTVLIYICGLAILSLVLGAIAVTCIALVIPFQNNPEEFYDLDKNMIWWNITIFLQVPVFCCIASYTILTHQFFVMVRRWLKGSSTSRFNPMLVLSLALAIASSAAWTVVAFTGSYSNLLLLYIFMASLLAGYFVYTIRSVMFILRRYPKLDKWSRILNYRLHGLIICNVNAIVFMLLAFAAASSPKTLSTTALDFASFASVFSKIGILFPITGLLFFLLGIYGVGVEDEHTTESQTRDNSLFETLFKSGVHRLPRSANFNDTDNSTTRSNLRRCNSGIPRVETTKNSLDSIGPVQSTIEDHVVTVC